MTASSKETGLPWSEGSDLVKSIPATEQMRDRQLAGALTLTAVSEQDLLSRFSSLGSNDYRRVRIPSLNQIREWDGQQWLIYDTKPIRVTDSGAYRLWYTGPNNTALNIGSGKLWYEYQRQGRTFKWQLYLERAENSNLGAGVYYFQSPVAIRYTGSISDNAGWVRCAADSWETPTRVVWTGSSTFRLVADSKTVIGSSSHSWAAGDIITAGGVAWVGGYK